MIVRHAISSSRFRHWIAPVVDFCFPRQCAACRTPFEAPDLLCPACRPMWQQLLSTPACHRCAMPAPFDELCPHCLGKGVYPFERIASLAVLAEPVRSIVHAIKYRNRWSLAEWLADEASARPAVRQVFAQAEVILPVPLFSARQVERGYNQSDVIGRRLSARFDLPVLAAAERIRETASQAHLKPRRDRFENLRGAFVLTRPELIRGKHVVVVDDVMTTGATLGVFGRALLSAEPASVSAFVLAVADPKGRQFEVI